jgi:PAS domain S-box-containing protein
LPPSDAIAAGPAASLLAAVRATTERLRHTAGMPALARAAAAEVRRLGGHDRVLLVEIGPDGTPRVLADDHRDGLPPRADLPFPAPPPALAVVGDTDAPTARHPHQLADWLRGHGAQAGFLLPLTDTDQAWGFFAGLHTTPRPLPDDIADACGLIGQTVSLLRAARRRPRAWGPREGNFRTLAAVAPVGIFLTDAAGDTLYVNDRLCEIMSRPAEEVRGRGWGRAVHSDDRARVEAAWNAAAAVGGEFAVEHRLRRPDGDVRWVVCRAVPRTRPDGARAGHVGTVTDVTELKRFEAELKAGEERFRALCTSAPLAIFQTDARGEVVYVNPGWEQLTGLTAARSLGGGVAAALHPDERASLFDAWERNVAVGRRWSRELRLVTTDGRVRWVRSLASPMYSEDGRFLGYVGTVEDVTERRAAEDELRRAKEAAESANRAKDEFLANVSHELRTPLNGILGMTELAHDDALVPSVRARMHVIQDAAESLLAIINDLLDLSRIGAGKLALHPEPFDPRQELLRALRVLAGEAKRKGLSLLSEIAPDLPPAVVGDPVRLRQVMVNLVGNAIKFTERGEVVVRVGAEEPRAKTPRREEDQSSPLCAFASLREILLHFEVKDTGIGIAPEDLARIFAPFEQADPSTTRRFGGSGLGLSIASRLVALMGGRIDVDSAPGRGSTFRFTARFGRANGVPPPAPVPPRGQTVARPLHVLLAEDNPINRTVTREMLERGGHRVHVVTDGREAVAACENEAFDLILMDVHMPGLDGFAATAAVRRLEEGTGRRTPVVALTARAMPGDRAECLRAGMDDYLAKPLRARDLYAAVARLCGVPEPSVDGWPPGPPAAGVDAAAVLAGVGGRVELLRDLVGLFRGEYPNRLAELRAALAEGAAGRVARAAHKLAGSLGPFHAAAVTGLARRLEAAGRAGDLSGAAPLLAELEAAAAGLDRTLGTIVDPSPSGTGGPTCAS